MKILFITNQLPPLVDGVGDYTYNIAKQFAKHNHEVYIVCKKNPKINIDIEGITVLPIVEKWNFNCHKPIVKFIKEKGIDIVFLQYVPHGFHSKGLPFPLIKLTKKIKKSQAKLFTFFHEVCIDYLGWNIKKTICSIGITYIAKRLIRNSNYIATSIEHYVKRIKRFRKEISVKKIRIASNIPHYDYNEEYLRHLKNKIAPNSEFIVLFFGKRDVDCQVEAIKELISEGKKIVALSLGNTYFLNLDYGIPTYKTGLLDINEISQYFQIADCFCLPENKESGATFKSGSLAAGLQYGLPIITNKGFMTEDTLIDGYNIIFTKDKDSFKSSLNHLIDNKTFEENIREHAKIIGKSLTWENTYQQYMNIISNL